MPVEGRGSGMTREELREDIEALYGQGDISYYVYSRLIDGVDTLEQEPCETSTDEPMTMVYPTIFCEDAISKNNVITTICQYGTTKERAGQYMITASEMKQDLVDLIDSLPSVQPSRPCNSCKHWEDRCTWLPSRKGHWISNNGYIWCSECNFRNSKRPNFCENCGADMRVGSK